VGLAGKNTYNTRDSLVVTDPTTSLALTGLSMGERTGSRAFQWVWSYVTVFDSVSVYIAAPVMEHLQSEPELYRHRL
jgi:hypothetical protein